MISRSLRFIKSLFLSPADEEALRFDLPTMRNHLLNDMLFWLACVTVPAVVLSLSRALSIGWRPLMDLHFMLLAMLWMLWLGRHWFSF